MNNNNGIYTNTFIGTSHLDSSKITSNLIISTSNILENHLSNTSNILENHINNSSNILNSNSSNFTTTTSNLILGRYDPLIRQKNEEIITPIGSIETYNTYITNSNIAGEIRFWCKYANQFPPYFAGLPEHRVKILPSGKLLCYYTFDPLINATYQSGWVDVINSIVGLNADSVNQGILITGLEAQILNLKNITADQFISLITNLEDDYIITSGARTRIQNELSNIALTSGEGATRTSMLASYNNFRAFINTGRISRLNTALEIINFRVSQNATAGFFLGIGGAVFGMLYGLIQSQKHNDFISVAVSKEIESNVSLTTEQKRNLHQSNLDDMSSNMIDQLEYMYNISINQGFINSNVITQQFIPSLKTNNLNLNNSNISSIGTLNANTGIFGSISTTNNTNKAAPSIGYFGGIGDKIILFPGASQTNYPYSIGLNLTSLWYSIPSGNSYQWFIDGAIKMSLTENDLTVIKDINISNLITQINPCNVSLAGFTTLSSNLTVNGNTILSGATSFSNTITQINPSNVSLAGFTTLSSNLTVNGNTILSGATSFSNTITQINPCNVSLAGFTTLSSNLTVSGNISENNKLLSNIYATNTTLSSNLNNINNTFLTSNSIYNLTYNYTIERQYQSKLFTSVSPEDTITLLEKLVYRQILYLDTNSIFYGSGFYEIYSSSSYDTPITKDKLFNYNTTETISSSRWAINQYNSGTGNYQADNSIDGSYYGDWVIIKLPQEIMLTKYRIYQRSDFPTKSPSMWKCYGSNDGITFTEITEASQITRLTTYSGGFYEKTLASTFTTQYQYIGFVFNALLSVSGQGDMSFAELQLFGKEIISKSITSNIYTTPNAVKNIVRYEMPDVGKRKGFIISIPTSSIFVDSSTNTTFYKYDLDLTKYTSTLNIPAEPFDPYRVFRIRCWYAPSYFSSFINGYPYVISYEIYMSNKTFAILGKPETAGINIFAVGNPENRKLSNILPNEIMILKNFNSQFNYLTVLSRSAPCDILCIIEDLLF